MSLEDLKFQSPCRTGTDGEVLVVTTSENPCSYEAALPRCAGDLVDQAEMYRVLIENATDVIVRADAMRRRIYVSPSVRQVLGYEPAELLGGHGYQLVHPDHLSEVNAHFTRLGPDYPRAELTFRMRRKDQTFVWIEARYSYLAHDGGILAILRDITARKLAETQLSEANAKLELANVALRRLADHDGLTDLCNRRHFDELLHQEFRRAAREQNSLGLVMLDIDYFKAFNDCYGHLAGDDCLRQVSRSVVGELLRAGDVAARYGGEEIIVLLPITDETGAFVTAERIRTAVASLVIAHRGSPLGLVTVSGGVSALLPRPSGSSPDALIEAADRALYLAKASGRNRICRTDCQAATAPFGSSASVN